MRAASATSPSVQPSLQRNFLSRVGDVLNTEIISATTQERVRAKGNVLSRGAVATFSRPSRTLATIFGAGTLFSLGRKIFGFSEISGENFWETTKNWSPTLSTALLGVAFLILGAKPAKAETTGSQEVKTSELHAALQSSINAKDLLLSQTSKEIIANIMSRPEAKSLPLFYNLGVDFDSWIKDPNSSSILEALGLENEGRDQTGKPQILIKTATKKNNGEERKYGLRFYVPTGIRNNLSNEKMKIVVFSTRGNQPRTVREGEYFQTLKELIEGGLFRKSDLAKPGGVSKEGKQAEEVIDAEDNADSKRFCEVSFEDARRAVSKENRQSSEAVKPPLPALSGDRYNIVV